MYRSLKQDDNNEDTPLFASFSLQLALHETPTKTHSHKKTTICTPRRHKRARKKSQSLLFLCTYVSPKKKRTKREHEEERGGMQHAVHNQHTRTRESRPSSHTHHFSARRGSCSTTTGLCSRLTTASRHTVALGNAAAPLPRPATAVVAEGPTRPRRRCARFGPRCSTFSRRRSRMHRRTVRSWWRCWSGMHKW